MKIVYIQPQTSVSESPILYLKPDTAIHNRELPLYIPDFTTDLRAQCVLMIKISKQGKCISEKFAYKYYEQISLGLNLIAYDKQESLIAQGKPWEESTSFDSAMVVGTFLSLSSLRVEDPLATFTNRGISFLERPLSCTLQELPFALRYISEYITLRTGDIVVIPLSPIFHKIEAETIWEGAIQGEKIFSVMIK